MDVPACGVADEAVAESESGEPGRGVEASAPSQPVKPRNYLVFFQTFLKITR
jgi:hypothetical protein